MCTVWPWHSKIQWIEWRICVKFCIKLEHPSVETMQMIQKATAMGNWWLTASSWQCAHSCITSSAELFGETSNHPVIQPHYSSDLVLCDFWLFPKLKSPLKGKRFQTIDEISGKYNGAADGYWENCVRSQHAYFEGDWGIIVLCTMFLVYCIISKCLFFHITWLDTFWTDLVIGVWNQYVIYLKYIQLLLKIKLNKF